MDVGRRDLGGGKGSWDNEHSSQGTGREGRGTGTWLVAGFRAQEALGGWDMGELTRKGTKDCVFA